MSNKKLSQLPDNPTPSADETSVAAVTASTTGGVTTYTNQIVTVRNLVKAGVQAGSVGLSTVATSGSYTDLANTPATFPPSSHNHDDRYYTEAETDTLLAGKQATGNYATLDGTGRVPAAQLPSYVDDVEEYANLASLPNPGQQGKIYVALDTNKIYRWSSTTYLEISPSPGSTDSVAEGAVNLYYTNARAAAAAPVQSVAGKTGAVSLTKTDVGLGNVPNVDATLRSNHTGNDVITASSGVPLTINNTGTSNSLVVNDASGDTTPFVIDADGAVGIGTNVPSTYSKALSAWSGTNGQSDVIASFYAQNGTQGVGIGYDWIGQIANSQLQLRTNGTARVTIGATGNVGIGTASPATRLDVAGADSAISVGTGSYGRYQLSGGNSTGYLYGSFAALEDGIHLGYNHYANAAGTNVIPNSGGPTSRITAGYGFAAIATSSANNTAPTEKLRVTGSGNVGIGTASPVHRLDVSGQIRATGAQDPLIISDATNNQNNSFWFTRNGLPRWYVWNNDATNVFNIGNPTTNPCMTIAVSGNVGIGTVVPGAKMEIVAGAGATAFKAFGAGASGVYIDFAGSAANYHDANFHIFRTAALAGQRTVLGIDNRVIVHGNSEPFGFGVRHSSSGSPVYFGAASSSATPDAVISNSGGAALMTLQNNGAITTNDGAISPRSIGPETIIEFTGNRTLALTDAGRLLVFTGTATTNITVPADASVNFPVGTRIRVMHAYAGGSGLTELNFTPFGGTPTIRAPSDGLTGPFSKYGFHRIPGEATITKIGANLWVLTGDARQR